MENYTNNFLGNVKSCSGKICVFGLLVIEILNKFFQKSILTLRIFFDSNKNKREEGESRSKLESRCCTQVKNYDSNCPGRKHYNFAYYWTHKILLACFKGNAEKTANLVKLTPPSSLNTRGLVNGYLPTQTGWIDIIVIC